MNNRAERQITAAEERRRCLSLVQNYRDKIERSLKPVHARLNRVWVSPVQGTVKINGGALVRDQDAVLIGEALIRSLTEICEEIRNPKRHKKSDGDFSMEEISEAMKIIDGLHNPFE